MRRCAAGGLGKLVGKFRHGPGALIRQDNHCFPNRFPDISRQGRKFRQVPPELVGGHPVHGSGRQDPGEGKVHGRGQSVHIRPGAGAALLGILLQGTEAALGYLHGGCAGIDAQILGSSQIQNFYRAVGQKHQVVRAYIPVNQTLVMDPCHSFRHRQENPFCLVPGQRAGLFQPFFQGFPLHIVHDNVGGLVLTEYLQYIHHLGYIGYPGHFPGLFQENFHAAVPGKPGLLRGVPFNGAAVCYAAADLAGGVIFLDGHLSLDTQIPAYVGDAEAALAQHRAYNIFPPEDGAGAQDKALGRTFCRVIPAVGTGISRDFFHAVKAAYELHVKHLPFIVSGQNRRQGGAKL